MEISAGLTAYNGIQNNFNRLSENSQQIANPNSESQDVAKNLINNKMTQTDIEALVKVLKTEDALLGQLLDIKA